MANKKYEQMNNTWNKMDALADDATKSTKSTKATKTWNKKNSEVPSLSTPVKGRVQKKAKTNAKVNTKANKSFAPLPEKNVKVAPKTRSKKQSVTPLKNDTGITIKEYNNTFLEAMFDQLEKRKNGATGPIVYTTNGSAAFDTTKSKLLDMNFKVASYRQAPETAIQRDFKAAFNENPLLAIRWLFYIRDCRGGGGEKRVFNVCMKYLASKKDVSWMATTLVSLIPEYGYYKDWFLFWDNDVMRKAILAEIVKVLNEDIKNYKAGKSVTLLAKYLPSNNASSQQSRKMALEIASYIGWSERDYRQTLSVLRKHIDVVERKMSSQNWQAIDYEKVPSKANLLYKNAFLKHDAERRKNYLDALSSGDAKVNASVATPHEIVAKYGYSKLDNLLEGMWKALPDYSMDGDTLVLQDGSGSMTSRIANGISCLDVSRALAIYFAEHNKGVYKDVCMTFGANPRLVDFSGDSTLRDKINRIAQNNDCSNTNLEVVFKMILDTAIWNNLSQEDLPNQILIISDMQFDAMCGWRPHPNGGWYNGTKPTKSDFENMAEVYSQYGYKLPKLIFWNLCPHGTATTFPLVQNDMGVILVSGYNPALIKSVLTGKLDPYEALVDTVMDKRYDPVTTALFNEAAKSFNFKS